MTTPSRTPATRPRSTRPRPPNGRPRHFEDYTEGLVVDCGTTRAGTFDIIEFGVQYDPQGMHIDPELAMKGPFKGLVASGWHTAALVTRLFVTRYLDGDTSLGSPGIDELRWPAPVRPDEELSVRCTVLEARRSRSEPDRGIVRTLVEVRNPDDEVVMSAKIVNLVRARKAAN